MTAPPDWSAHLARYEAAGVAALRAHLGIEHPATWRSFGLSGPDACRDIHRRIHQPVLPDRGDWFDLDPASLRLVVKAARLAVVREPGLNRKAIRAGQVRGDSGRWYRCWVSVAGPVWRGACERGGAHDNQPDGAACSHPLALAGVVAAEEPDLFPTRTEAPA